MKSIVSLTLLCFFSIQLSAQVGIGTSTPHASAKLEVSSSTQGFLPPRVSLTSTNAASPVTSPETGLLVYNIAPNGSGATAVTPGFYYWGGSAWVRLIVPTDNAANVTGTVAVANGGSGATTLTGILKGNGTSAFTTATAGTDYLAPNGSAANLTNFPTLNQNTTGTAGNVTGVVAVANGGTGATTLTGILKGNGTSAFTAAVAGTDYQAPISGTTNYLPKVTGAATVGNSQVFDNGTSVGIGTNNPNTNAILDLTSSNKGLLLPRLNSAQRDAISSPTEGLMIYNTTSSSLEVYAKARKGERSILRFAAGVATTGATSMWQEFTPIVSGFVTKITLTQNAVDAEFAMKIHSGVTSTNLSALNGGKVIGYTSLYIPSTASGYVNYDYTFSNPVYVEANTKYWFQITTISGNSASIYFNFNSDVYPAHNSYVGGHNFEPNFTLFLQPVGESNWVSFK